MTRELGALACTAAGGLVIDVEVDRYLIAPEDVHSPVFSSRPAPATCSRVRRERGVPMGEITIEAPRRCTPAGSWWPTSSVMRGGERHLCYDCLKTAK